MTEIELRIPFGRGAELREALRAAGDHEHVVFLLVSHVRLPGRVVLLVRHVMRLPEAAYLRQAAHGAAWRGASMVPIIDRAVEERLGVVLVHEHAQQAGAALSRDDIQSAGRIVPMLRNRVPGRPHGSIVLVAAGAEGIIALPQQEPEQVRVAARWLGARIALWEASVSKAEADGERFATERLVVGSARGVLGRAAVVVVGLSGGGSHVVQQLAHLGIGTVVGVDDDLTEERQRGRMVGFHNDVQVGTPKVEVMSRLVDSIRSGTRFIPTKSRVPELPALEALRTADLIVGCVDTLHARQDIQEIAWRFAVPYVDAGVSLRAVSRTDDGPRVLVGGNVLTLVPGGFCMWCCGFLSREKLDAELDGPNKAYLRNLPGEAQVVSMNGVVASQAVNEVLRLLTGFGGSGITAADLALPDGGQRGFLKFDGVRGTLEDWGATQRADCKVCNDCLAMGDTVWG